MLSLLKLDASVIFTYLGISPSPRDFYSHENCLVVAPSHKFCCISLLIFTPSFHIYKFDRYNTILSSLNLIFFWIHRNVFQTPYCLYLLPISFALHKVNGRFVSPYRFTSYYLVFLTFFHFVIFFIFSHILFVTYFFLMFLFTISITPSAVPTKKYLIAQIICAYRSLHCLLVPLLYSLQIWNGFFKTLHTFIFQLLVFRRYFFRFCICSTYIFQILYLALLVSN